jgi:hypothetical protein
MQTERTEGTPEEPIEEPTAMHTEHNADSTAQMYTQPEYNDPYTPPTSPLSRRSTSPLATPTGYDIDRPQYLYSDNGDGSLTCVGLAGPQDFYFDGTIHGPRPSRHQPNPENIQLESDPDDSPKFLGIHQPNSPNSPPNLRLPSPITSMGTQATTASSITTQISRQPIPAQKSHYRGEGSPNPSLPAEGAQHD